MSTSNQCSSKYWAQISPFVLYTLKTFDVIFLRFFQVNGKMVYGFWNSHSRIIEDSGLLRCDTESLGNLLRTFRKNLSSLSWTAGDPWTSESEPRPTIQDGTTDFWNKDQRPLCKPFSLPIYDNLPLQSDSTAHCPSNTPVIKIKKLLFCLLSSFCTSITNNIQWMIFVI